MGVHHIEGVAARDASKAAVEGKGLLEEIIKQADDP